MKWFCPWCGSELLSNQVGASHVNALEAWYKMECEYQVGDVSKHFDKNYPVSELQKEKWQLKDLLVQLTSLAKTMDEKTKRIEQLQKEWDQTYGNTINK